MKRSTRDRILETAIDLLNRRGVERFTLDEVLVEADASPSSLYHHFGNREGLLVAVEEERYRRRMRAEDRSNFDAGRAATTTEDFLAHVAAQLRRIVTDPANLEVRRERVQIAGRAFDSPELAKRTRIAQEKLIVEVAAFLAEAQARGFINDDLDPRAYAVWFHGLTVGRTVAEEAIDVEAWLAIAIPAALAPLRPST